MDRRTSGAIDGATRALLPAQREGAAARLQGRGPQQVDFEVRVGHRRRVSRAQKAHAIRAGRPQSVLFDRFGGPARRALGLHTVGDLLQHAVAPVGEHHAGAQRALDGGGGKIRSGSAGGERRDMQAVAGRPVPIGGIGGVLEGDAAPGEVLRESAPGGEIQLFGRFELIQVAFETRSLGQQPENAPLVEHVHMILPDHVIDGAELFAVADQQRGQAGEAVAHQRTSGRGIESANPAR
jgi:hypothetical protein